MTATDPAPSVVQLLAKVMADLPAIPKTQHADPKMGGYAFRGIDQFYDAAQPVLARHGVVVIPQVENVERTTYQSGGQRTMHLTLLTVRYSFHGPAGDSLDAVVVGEGSDVGDKSATKALATAQKYALMQVLMVPVAGTPDADQHSGEPDETGSGTSYSDEADDDEPISGELAQSLRERLTHLENAGAPDVKQRWAAARFPALERFPRRLLPNAHAFLVQVEQELGEEPF